MVGTRGLLAAATPFYNFCRPGGYFHGSRTNQEVVQKMYICMNNWILTFLTIIPFWTWTFGVDLTKITFLVFWGFCGFWRFLNKRVPKFLRLMTNRFKWFKYIFQNLKLSTRLLTALLMIFCFVNCVELAELSKFQNFPQFLDTSRGFCLLYNRYEYNHFAQNNSSFWRFSTTMQPTLQCLHL